ncbi:MAG: tetratricopeptide repeat protein [Ahniella sp.]|nr:tetratricopeptide repeat protein [Ahniella sp.]
MQDFDTALTMHRAVYARRLEVLPSGESDHEQSLYNIAKCLWKLHRPDEARAALQQGLQRSESDWAPGGSRRGLQMRLLSAQLDFDQETIEAHIRQLWQFGNLPLTRSPDTFALSVIWMLEAQAWKDSRCYGRTPRKRSRSPESYLGRDTSRDIAGLEQVHATSCLR